MPRCTVQNKVSQDHPGECSLWAERVRKGSEEEKAFPSRCPHTVGHSGLQTAALSSPEGDTLGRRAEIDVREVPRGLDTRGNYSDASSVQ